MEQSPQAPVSLEQRITVVDMLRGFALFGILLVNMRFYSLPYEGLSLWDENWTGAVDQIVKGSVTFLAEGKFITLFSMLFGLGLVLQFARAESRGARYLPLYLRRLLVLLLFGLIHATVLWAGDILVIYAVTGLVLVLFRNASPRALRVWIAISLALPVLWVGAMTGIYNLTRLIVPGAEGLEARATQRQRLEAEMALETYNEGSFVERFAQRVSDLKLSYAGLAINGWFLNGLALFLMGLYVGKSGILQDVQAHLGAIRRARWWGLGLGLTGASMTLWGDLAANPIRPTFATLVEMAGHAVGDPALAVFYGASLVLLVQDERWQKRLAPLAAAGRLALTNYLAQSLIVTTVLTGFGLFGKVGPAAGLIMTVVIYAAQLVFSQWWTARFRFGPAEWLWRTLQYGKRQPMRLPG